MRQSVPVASSRIFPRYAAIGGRARLKAHCRGLANANCSRPSAFALCSFERRTRGELPRPQLRSIPRGIRSAAAHQRLLRAGCASVQLGERFPGVLAVFRIGINNLCGKLESSPFAPQRYVAGTHHNGRVFSDNRQRLPPNRH